jgi:predicted KAP-like P-loop ATPase
MTSDDQYAAIGLDQPLQAGNALESDKLERSGFARSAVASLRQVTSAAGFVLSIEGAWGSGKTSTLAMIEGLLGKEPKDQLPHVVHFNPWLIGDRDALLRQFLAKLASAVKLTDHAKEGQKVAKELKAYAKAFDVVKLIPGAEPWASIVKSVVESVGQATGSVAEHKMPDIELQKKKVEAALQKFARRIIVFIDDVDRLFPLEVFEMVRIVKAVGDLPNVGYVLAWDPAYVSRALESASVPQSDTYLDKIVQVRMPLPGLSISARGALINDSLKALNPEALKSHFPRDEDRLSALYFSGLRDVLEHPRDVTRVFNTVSIIEPALRGEVVFSDIVGLSALMVKATAVFDLLRKQPRWFVGHLPGEHSLLEKTNEIMQEGTQHLDAAYSTCSMPVAVRKMVHFLFPLMARVNDEFVFSRRVTDIEGHLAAPARLLVAIQQSVSATDVSLVRARRFLFHSEQREEIALSLTVQNCLEFMVSLGDVVESIQGKGISDLNGLRQSIARLADAAPFPLRSKERSGPFALPVEKVAMRAVDLLVKSIDPNQGPVAGVNYLGRSATTILAGGGGGIC